MEKKRTFLLLTLILCLLGLFIIPLFSTFGLMVMGENISFLSVYHYWWYTIFHNIFGITLSSIIVLISVLGSALMVLMLLLGFIFFFLGGKKRIFSILSYVFVGLTLLTTVLVMGSLIVVTALEFWLEFAFYLVYTMRPIDEDGYGFLNSYYSYYFSHLDLTFAINRTVRGGMMGTATPLMLVTLLFPTVTYILSLVFLKKKKPAQVEEQPEVVEETK